MVYHNAAQIIYLIPTTNMYLSKCLFVHIHAQLPSSVVAVDGERNYDIDHEIEVGERIVGITTARCATATDSGKY
jgi:hypothetical protein